MDDNNHQSVLQLVQQLSLDDNGAIDKMIPLVEQALASSKSNNAQKEYQKKQLDSTSSYNWFDTPRLKPKSDCGNTDSNTPTLPRKRRDPPPPPVKEATKTTTSHLQSQPKPSRKSQSLSTESPNPKPRRRVPPPPPTVSIDSLKLPRRERAVSSPDCPFQPTQRKPGLLFTPPPSRTHSLNKTPIKMSSSPSLPITKQQQSTFPSQLFPYQQTAPSKTPPHQHTGPSKTLPHQHTAPSKTLPHQHTAPSKTLPYQHTISSKVFSTPTSTAPMKLLPPGSSVHFALEPTKSLPPPTKPLPPLPTEPFSPQTPTSDADYAFIPDPPSILAGNVNVLSPSYNYSTFKPDIVDTTQCEYRTMMSGTDELDNDECVTKTSNVKPNYKINNPSPINDEEEYITMAASSRVCKNGKALRLEDDAEYISMSPSHQSHQYSSQLDSDQYVSMVSAIDEEYITMTSPRSQVTDDSSDLKPTPVHRPTLDVKQDAFTSMYIDLDMINIQMSEEHQEGKHPKSRFLIKSAPSLPPRGSKSTKNPLKDTTTSSVILPQPISDSVSKPQKYPMYMIPDDSNDVGSVGVYATIPEIQNLYYS